MNSPLPAARPITASPASELALANASLDHQLNQQEWNARTIILATLTACTIILGFFLIYRFYMAVFLLFTALALQVAFQPAVEAIHRRGVPRATGVFLIYALLLLLVLLFVWFTAPLIVDQARAVINDLPAYYQLLRDSLTNAEMGLVRGFAQNLPNQLSYSAVADLLGATVVPAPAVGGATVAAAQETAQSWQTLQVGGRTLFAIFAVFALAFYWTLERDVILRRLILKAPTEQREELRALISEIQNKIGAYFRGQLILCVIIGVLSTLAFFLLSVPNALILGILMGIFEAIPVLGPTLGAIPAVLLTLATAPEQAIWVVVALVVIQGLENNFLVPRIMDQSVGINAVVSILAIAAFGALFGITGAILAIPLAAILQILLNRLLFNVPLSEEASPSLVTPPDMGRGQLGFLRLQAQELAHDIRKQARSEADAELPDSEAEQVEDKIESLALDLDNLLAQLENAVETARSDEQNGTNQPRMKGPLQSQPTPPARLHR